MVKDVLKLLLYDWQNRDLPVVLPRELDIDKYIKMKLNKVIVLNGFRRVGKTYLLMHVAKELLKTNSRRQVVYLNFEDERIPLKTEFLTELIPTIEEMWGEAPKYLLLDEVQLVPNWSKWVRRIYDQYNIRFFITGSNSKMTTVGIPTELRGRFIEKHIYPLNFREYLQFKKINIEVENIEYNQRVKSKLLKHVGDYLRIGGLPEIVLSQDDDFNELVQGYFRTVVSRDIIELHNIQNVNGLKALLKILLNSKEFTVNRIFNVLKSMNHEIGKTTLQNYIGYAHDAFFLNAVEAFSFKVVKAELHPRKVYFVDNAFIKFLSTKLSDDKARFFENSVAVLLQSKTEELKYFKTLNNQYEVDFVIRDHDKIKQLIQVCSDISNSKTMEREIRAFAQAQGELKCKNHLLINADTDKTEKVNWFGKKLEVRMIPLYRWLLEY